VTRLRTILLLILTAFSLPVFAGAVRLSADASTAVLPANAEAPGTASFTLSGEPVFWGVGWEVIPNRTGFGGEYLVSFSQDTGRGWWLDWYAPALYLSWHPAGTRGFVDPSFQIGIGSAGRVRLSGGVPGTLEDRSLSLALFPFLAGGLNLTLDHLLLGARAIYTPWSAPIPATTIPAYPLGELQVTVSAGISLGW
jgi:hypothetical protein